ncbi:MAG: FAD-dependent oxidoreductase [Candidatus Gastranaerophilales bacterium]
MKILILGGVAAGAKAAAKARRMAPDAEINLYTDGTHVSYSACGMPYYIEGNFEDYRELLVRSPKDFLDSGVNIHLRNKAVKILPDSKQVLIECLETRRAFLEDYDKLIIAIGARPIIPPIKNVQLPNVFTLRTLEDGIAIKEQVLKAKHATIIGAGYIGMELLEAFVHQKLRVTMVEYAKNILPVLDEDMSILVEEQLATINDGRFEIITSELVTEFSGDMTGIKSVKLGSGKEFKTDLVVICTGVTPNVEIAREAGIEIGITGAIKVNERMETNYEDIYACGDCVEETLIVDNSKIWLPLGSNANKEGRTAAINACGGDESFHGVLASTVTRCLNLTLSMTGLTEKNARKKGYDVVSTVVTKYDKVGYMPNVNNISLKLIADKKTGQLLGGQAIGCGDADKRINALTAGLLGKMTVKEFYKNDLTYAPPYSPTIDPLLNATQILMDKIDSNND